MKFRVGDIIINKSPLSAYDKGIILEVGSDYYTTWWYTTGTEYLNPMKNDDLVIMHSYNIITSIFRDALN